jgi:hypothetical protein
MTMDDKNAGVTKGSIKFCDLRCPYAEFPRDEAIDGSGSCRTFIALWCVQLQKLVTKNAPCEVIFGARRPKTGF